MSSPEINMDFVKGRPVSYSSLKEFDSSPMDYVYYVSTPRKPPTDEQIVGKATEILVFEEDKFDKLFLVHGKLDKRSKDGKEKFLELINQARESKKTLIGEDLVEKARGMSEEVKRNEKIQPYLQGVNYHQRRIQWTDPDTRIPLIMISDEEGILNGEDYVIEFKTTQDASADGWIKQAYKFKYHIQIGMQYKAYRESSYRFPNLLFVEVESNEPYKSNIHYCSSKYIEKCVDEVNYLLQSFKYCMDEGLFNLGYEFWMIGLPFNQMSLPGFNQLRSRI